MLSGKLKAKYHELVTYTIDSEAESVDTSKNDKNIEEKK